MFEGVSGKAPLIQDKILRKLGPMTT
uniref:Uncharacterized protein n=1 Tax=Anguilla anguilla TaxID=7936 RepID=A0A0E9URD2_ANGAN